MLFVLLVVLTILFVIFVVRQLLLQRRIAARQHAAAQRRVRTGESGASRAYVGETHLLDGDRNHPTKGSDDDA